MAISEKNLGGGQKDESWIILQHEKPHTRERHPQYNADNVSQAELAGSPVGIGDGYVHVGDTMAADAQYGYRPGSDNAESGGTSTDTGASTDTATAVNTVGITPAIPSLSLNKTFLGINERECLYSYAGNTAEWVWSINGVGDRTQCVEYMSPGTDSTYLQTENSKGSTVASTIDFEDDDWDALALSLNLREIGAWCKRFQAPPRQ